MRSSITRRSLSTLKSWYWLYASMTEFRVSMAARVSMVSSAPPKSRRTSSDMSSRSWRAPAWLVSRSSVMASRIWSSLA